MVIVDGLEPTQQSWNSLFSALLTSPSSVWNSSSDKWDECVSLVNAMRSQGLTLSREQWHMVIKCTVTAKRSVQSSLAYLEQWKVTGGAVLDLETFSILFYNACECNDHVAVIEVMLAMRREGLDLSSAMRDEIRHLRRADLVEQEIMRRQLNDK